MYLLKCEEYTGVQLIGAATNGELYKGIVSFMIIGIKQNTAYIRKSAPEINIHPDWLKNQIIGCLNPIEDGIFFGLFTDVGRGGRLFGPPP